MKYWQPKVVLTCLKLLYNLIAGRYVGKSEHLWHKAPPTELFFIYIYLSIYLHFLNGIKRTYISVPCV